jgi:spore coat protein U-like protein
MKKLLIALVAGGAIAAPAFATIDQTQTTNMLVKANVLKSCNVKSVVDLDFGDVKGNLADLDETTHGQLNLVCTKNTDWLVSADNGQNANGSLRQMADAVDGTNTTKLQYNLFADSGHGTAFPTDVASSGSTLGTHDTGTGDPNTPQVVNIYGRIPAGQVLVPDPYLDTVMLTISY